MALGFGGFQVSASQLQVLRVQATGQCVMDVGVVLNMVSVSSPTTSYCPAGLQGCAL